MAIWYVDLYSGSNANAGTSWSAAWRTLGEGATAAAIAPGDEIRVSRTPDAVDALVSASYTYQDKNVYLSAAKFKNINTAISSTAAWWTASANITLGTASSRKVGGSSLNITPGAAFTTGLMCWAPLIGGGAQDLSAYTGITFWAVPSAATAAGSYQIKLCSDTAGATAVNTFDVPNIYASGMTPIYIDSGSALGTNIRTVALYAVIDPGTTQLSVNNISVCNSDVHLGMLFGPSGSTNHLVSYLSGSTQIGIDNGAVTAATTAYNGYSGTTQSGSFWTRNYFTSTSININTDFVINEGGDTTLTGSMLVTGGWNTASNAQDGITFLGTQNTQNTVLRLPASHNGLTVSNFGFVLGNNLVSTTTGASTRVVFDKCTFIAASSAGLVVAQSLNYITSCSFYNNHSGISILSTINIPTNDTVYVYNPYFYGNVTSIAAPNKTSRWLIYSASSVNNTTGYNINLGELYDCEFNDATEISLPAKSNGVVTSFNHDRTANNHVIYYEGSSTATYQTAVTRSGDDSAWAILTATGRKEGYPVKFKVAEMAITASSWATASLWVKKSATTGTPGASFYVEYAPWLRLAYASASKTDDTNWENLSINFSSSVDGVASLYLDTWYQNTAATIYVGSFSGSQQ